MRYFFILLIYLVGLFFVPKACLAIGVIINEVAWAGSSESANDEWLELYNPASAKVDLSGWSLVAGDGSPAILLVGSIEGEAYYLLERTDDDSAVGVCADQIYSGSLSNSGEALVLIDNNDVVIDSLDCHDDWLAGDSSTRLGMQKINNLWVDNCSSEGSPRRDNVVCEESFDDEDVVELVEVEEVETNETLAEAVDLASEGIGNLETINSPVAGKIVKKVELPPVIISEIMPNPLGVDSEE